MKRRRLIRSIQPPVSGFAGFRFPPEVILIAVRWYLRYGLSYRDLEELLAERGIEVDHVTLFRWVQRFTPLLIDAARPCRLKGPKTPMHGRLQENRRDCGASDVRGGVIDPEEPFIRLAKFLPI